MELGFDKVSYEGFKDISYEFEIGKITSVISSDRDIFLLSRLLRKSNLKYLGDIVNSFNDMDIGYVREFMEDEFSFNTIREEIYSSLLKHGYDKEKIEKRTLDTLSIMGLPSSYLERNPLELSSGEKRLLSIALILAYNPHLIIMDNPSSYLDSKGREYLIKLLKRLRKDYHKTIIIFSSDVSWLINVTDNFVLFRNKKIYDMGSIRELLNSSDKLKRSRVDVPRIMEFIDKARDKNVNLDYTFDVKELMKDIYRNVK